MGTADDRCMHVACLLVSIVNITRRAGSKALRLGLVETPGLWIRKHQRVPSPCLCQALLRWQDRSTLRLFLRTSSAQGVSPRALYASALATDGIHAYAYSSEYPIPADRSVQTEANAKNSAEFAQRGHYHFAAPYKPDPQTLIPMWKPPHAEETKAADYSCRMPL